MEYFFNECFSRWQNPQPGKDSKSARITETHWAQTPSGVTTTIKDMSNSNNKNDPLWLQGTFSLLYAGVYVDQSRPITPQSGLNEDETVLSVILPSGVEKLNKVSYDPHAGFTADEKRRVTGIFGLALKSPIIPLVPADYAYINNKYVSQEGLKKVFAEWSKEYDAAKTKEDRETLESVHIAAFDGDGKTIHMTFTGVSK